jgi:hypothetical protein
MTLPRLRYIAMGAPLAIVTGLAGVWIAKPSHITGLTVARGTSVQIQLSQMLASDQSRPGDQFEATLTEPVLVDGEVAIPQGVRIRGKVVDVNPASKLEGPARLRLTLNSIQVNRMIYELHTTDVARYGGGYEIPLWQYADVVSGPATKAGQGMLINAPVDSGAQTSKLPTSGSENVRLSAETPLKFRLIEPLILPHKR